MLRAIQCIALLTIAAGVGLIYIPAGLIVGGILVVVAVELLAPANKDETEPSEVVE